MCAMHILHHVKIELRPERARSHVKAADWYGVMYRKESSPQMKETIMEARGRPARSTYARKWGAWPCSANAWSVRVAA